MKRVLDPLACIAGVRRAILLSRDGVPITHIMREKGASGEEDGHPIDSAEDLSAFAGMAQGLLAEIRRAVDPMSWDEPKRIVLTATRGTLILLMTERANIAVELDRGMFAEELRLPMESVVARLARSLDRTPKAGDAGLKERRVAEPPGLFPGHVQSSGPLPELKSKSGKQVPNTRTES